MKKQIIINSTVNDVRAAILEEANLAEYFIEFPDKQNIVGNIYLGKVTNIVQGINAAFINVGFKNDAFLHFSDVDESLESSVILDEEDSEDAVLDLPNEENQLNLEPTLEIVEDVVSTQSDQLLRKVKSVNKNDLTFQTKKSGEIQINIQEGQDLIVQVTREAYSNKGVKVSTKIAIPGKYLVILPFDRIFGVSRKIQSFQERKRLRYIVKQLNSQYGCIIRTASKGKTIDELKDDWEHILSIWSEIEKNLNTKKVPSLIYNDFSLAKSIARDLFDHSVENLWIDSKVLYKDTLDYVKWFSPKLVSRVKLYDSKLPIFEHFNLEDEISNIYRRNVKLKSGGSIVLDQTEAMMVVDVNSGRSVDKDQEKMAFNTNVEAAREIAKQIRLRDIGGMIVVDFIDMQLESNRKKLFNFIKNEMSTDRAKWVAYPLSQLGLLQITRQRINQNIAEKISAVCSCCHGTGKVPTSGFSLNKIEKWIQRFKSKSKEFRLLLRVNPSVADELTKGTISKLSKLMFRYFVRIKVLQDESIEVNHFKFYSVRNQKDITKDYLK